MSEQVINLLDRLAMAESGLDAMKLRKQEIVDSVLTPEIKQELDDIEVEFREDIDHMKETVKLLEKQVKELTVDFGESIDGEYKKVIYFKGRTSWNGKALEGYSAAHPEILRFKKTGSPYASIRNK